MDISPVNPAIYHDYIRHIDGEDYFENDKMDVENTLCINCTAAFDPAILSLFVRTREGIIWWHHHHCGADIV